MIPEYKLLNKIFSRTKETDSGCKIWQGSSYDGNKGNGDRYGNMSYKNKGRRIHRLVASIYYQKNYEDQSWTANHTCRNTLCCNPLHIYVGTIQSNNIDKAREGTGKLHKTHCKLGHEYTRDNIYYNDRGSKMCKKCINDRSKLRSKRKAIINRELRKQKVVG